MEETIEEKTTSKKEIHKAHDLAFKAAMQDLRVAQDFFSHHLPETIRERIDLTTLRLHRESFVDPELTELVSDMLYSVALKGENDKAQRMFLYLLVEHVRDPEVLMPWRAVKYTVRAIDQCLIETGSKTLPLIVPIVVYNGKRKPYPYSVSVFDLFGENKNLAKAFLFNQFQLIDLSQIPDETIREHQWCGLLEMVMKHIDARNITMYLNKISDLVKGLISSEADNYILAMIKYMIEKSEITDRAAFNNWTQSHLSPPLEEKTMTLAEQWMAEGYERGLQQGTEKTMTLAEQWMAEGYEKGLQEGREKTMTLAEQLKAEGYEKGRTLAEQWKIEGYERGLQEGQQLRTEEYQQGMQKSMKKGMQQTLALLQEGKSLEEITQLIEKSFSISREA
jgi:predicted transposase/invertase (TIGR01784 family)